MQYHQPSLSVSEEHAANAYEYNVKLHVDSHTQLAKAHPTMSYIRLVLVTLNTSPSTLVACPLAALWLNKPLILYTHIHGIGNGLRERIVTEHLFTCTPHYVATVTLLT